MATDQAELKRVFQMFDHNEDGNITMKELSDSLQNLGIHVADEDLTQMFDKFDEEFGALYKALMEEKKDEDNDMREAFSVFDQNGDGYITVEELKSVMELLGMKQGKTIEDCKKMISNVDNDGDGRVNFNEFKKMMDGGKFVSMNS